MDRSFLSQAPVIDASRAFVCARLATYEDKEEGVFLKNLVRTRSGELENSVFALLAPDGKTTLAPASRGPRRSYANARQMAEDMTRLARKFTPAAGPAALPAVTSARLGITVAAADNLPLVVVLGKAEARKGLVEKVTALAWGKEHVGRFIYALAESEKDLPGVTGVKAGAGVVVVEPDRFGTGGKALAQAGADATAAGVGEALTAGSKAYGRAAAVMGSHLRAGREKGVFYVPPQAVTDPQEAQARRRGR